MTRCSLTVWAILLTLFCTIPAMTADGQTQDMCNGNTVCVLTWQQDTGTDITAGYAYRTGQNLSDSITASTFNSNAFGQKCSQALNGQVYAQPLVVTDVNWNNLGPTYTIVYVVTQNDKVYAIDGTNCAILGTADLLQNNPNQGMTIMTAVDCGQVGGRSCSPINPRIGVLGTPVISLTNNNTVGRLYVVAETQALISGTNYFYHFLDVLDITTLNEGVNNEAVPGAPLQICSDLPPPGGSTCGSYPSATQFSKEHIQRPGLLYVPANKITGGNGDDYVYVAFSMMDGTTPPNFPNGVLLGYDAFKPSDTAASRLYFQSSIGNNNSQSNGGGIWMSGAAPAFGPDANTGSNRIYLTTANGTWDANSNWGNSFIELDPATLTVPTGGYFTPADQWYRSAWTDATHPACLALPTVYPPGGDQDVGVGGVMLIPDSELTKWPYLAVNGEKEGGIWFYDRAMPMPSRTTACDNQPGQNGVCNCPESKYPDHTIGPVGNSHRGARTRCEGAWHFGRLTGLHRGRAISTQPPTAARLLSIRCATTLMLPAPLIRQPVAMFKSPRPL